jgi:hypothetical protein
MRKARCPTSIRFLRCGGASRAAFRQIAAVPGPVATNGSGQQNNNGGLDFWLLDKLFGRR